MSCQMGTVPISDNEDCRNNSSDFPWFISAHAPKNLHFRLLLRFLRHRAKMAVSGSNPCHMPFMEIWVGAAPGYVLDFRQFKV